MKEWKVGSTYFFYVIIFLNDIELCTNINEPNLYKEARFKLKFLDNIEVYFYRTMHQLFFNKGEYLMICYVYNYKKVLSN